MDKETFDAGMALRREVLGDTHVDRSLEMADALTRPLQDILTEYGWGAIWTRPELDRRTRSLITVAMLCALNRPHELRLHLSGALSNGCSREEIVETVMHAGVYCGMPAALEGMRHAKAVFGEDDAGG